MDNQSNKNFDYNTFLNFWNLCTDVSASTGINFLGDKKGKIRNSVYDKLFDVAGPFIEEWPDSKLDEKEIAMLAAVLDDGMSLLFDSIAVIED